MPTDDAYLQGTTRFNDAYLKVEAGRRVSYLKFNVSGLSGSVGSATLQLRENGDLGSGTLRVYRGSHNSWTETSLSTANAPGENGQLGTFTGAVAAGQVVSVDVSSLITGDGIYSVIVKMDAGGNDIWFGSEESTRKPQLIVETVGGVGTSTYALTVNSGTGSGSYAAGTTVNLVAASAPSGQEFDRWTGDVGTVANVNAATTTLTMPSGRCDGDGDVSGLDLAPTQYALTVNSGTGSGSYAAGATVNLVAASAPSGQEFDRWTGDVGTVANVNAATTTLTMPAAAATVTATYRAASVGGTFKLPADGRRLPAGHDEVQ